MWGSAIYLPLHAMNADEDKVGPQMEDGIRQGANGRTEGHIIGIDEGINWKE